MFRLKIRRSFPVVATLARAWAFRPLATAATLLALAGCGLDMADQPHYEPLEASDFFADGKSARQPVAGTVARGNLRTDKVFFDGQVDGELVTEFPQQQVAARLKLTGDDQQIRQQILTRGQERYNIFCAACHDRTGSGQGMVVQRGFPAPPSYHIDRLRHAPIGHFFDVPTRGFGRMPDYADQIPTADRWAIAAYIRALQLSQHAEADALAVEDRKALSTSHNQQ